MKTTDATPVFVRFSPFIKMLTAFYAQRKLVLSISGRKFVCPKKGVFGCIRQTVSWVPTQFYP